MAKAITGAEVNLIVEMIRHWPKGEKLTWNNICKGSQSIIGYLPTRQGLAKKTGIAQAYDVKTKKIRFDVDKLSNVARPRSIQDAIERLAKLEAENEQLKGEIQKMAEVAQRFIHNASVEGFTREQIMKPLPKKK